MLNFAAISNAVTRQVSTTGLSLKKHSPTILTGIGVVGVIAAGVLASRASLKLEKTLESRKLALTEIKESNEMEISDEDRKKAIARSHIQTGVELVKLYGPSITLGAVSVGCILVAHGEMRRRNVVVMAAYKALETTFESYRNEVKERYGEEAELSIRRNEKVVEIETDEGKKAKVVRGHVGNSPYARIFDHRSSRWQGNSEYDLFFLQSQETIFNQILHAKGHLFLNDVYEALGLLPSKEGQLAGWRSDGTGDNYVSFGVFEDYFKTKGEHVNNLDRVIYLDFNVDGIIIDAL